MTPDPFTVEIVQSSLQAASDEMFSAMRKTAMSSIIYEVLDLGTCVTDAAGNLASSGAGIPAFFTPTGVGTVVADGKPQEEFHGQMYVRETWLRADLAIVKAWRADTAGNLMFRKTARNFNPIMAAAADVTVVEAEEIVEPGALDPDCVHTPGIHVDRIVRSTINEKRIEFRTVRPREDA